MKTLARLAVATGLLAIGLGLFAKVSLSADPPDAIDSFLKHVDGLQVDQAIKQQARSAVESQRSDEYTRAGAIGAGLSVLYPEYAMAIAASDSNDAQNAIDQLRPHVDSDDSFLAADASFLLSRSLMISDRHEEALPILEGLISNHSQYTLHLGSALYFCGVAQANLLENQRALQSFAAFLDGFPEAPERLRVAAWRQMQMIQAIQEGSMDDIHQRMDFSRRRLDLENTGETTQHQQDKIVGMLAKLIREQEKKECASCNSSSNSQSQQEAEQEAQAQRDKQGKSNAGGSSQNNNGVARKTFDDGPASPWSRLRDRSRDAANTAIKEKLPARYRAVVEKYYEKTSGSGGSKDN